MVTARRSTSGTREPSACARAVRPFPASVLTSAEANPAPPPQMRARRDMPNDVGGQLQALNNIRSSPIFREKRTPLASFGQWDDFFAGRLAEYPSDQARRLY